MFLQQGDQSSGEEEGRQEMELVTHSIQLCLLGSGTHFKNTRSLVELQIILSQYYTVLSRIHTCDKGESMYLTLYKMSNK